MKFFNNKDKSKLIFGGVLIFIGIIVGLKAFGLDVGFLLKGWWALFIIIPCIVGIIKSDRKKEYIIGLVIGVLLFICTSGLLTFDFWKLCVAVGIVYIGIRCMFNKDDEDDDDGKLHYNFKDSDDDL